MQYLHKTTRKQKKYWIKRSENKLIHIAKPMDFEYQEFLDGLQVLQHEANDNNEARIYSLIKQLVPTYIGKQTE